MVAGNPKLDAFAETGRLMDDAARTALRQEVGAEPGQHLVVVATKFAQIAGAFGQLIDAVAKMPDVRMVVKCHPAETGAPYERAASATANVAIAPASADLSRLVAAARLLVTVNSTAAIEAMVLGVPSLVLAMPNNLTPFVEAGAMSGVFEGEPIGPALRRLLTDERGREELLRRSAAFMARYRVGSDGGAARRAAEAIVRLASGTGRPGRIS